MRTLGDLINMLKGLYELIVEFFNTFIKKEDDETTESAE